MAIAPKLRRRVLAMGSIAVLVVACFVVVMIAGGRGPAMTITIERIDVSESGEEILIWTKTEYWKDVETASALRGMDGSIQLLGSVGSIGSNGPFSRWISHSGGNGFVQLITSEPESFELYVDEGECYRLRYGEELVMARYVTGRDRYRETVEYVETVTAP